MGPGNPKEQRNLTFDTHEEGTLTLEGRLDRIAFHGRRPVARTQLWRRPRVSGGFGHLGIAARTTRNAAHANVIQGLLEPDRGAGMHPDEELMSARSIYRALGLVRRVAVGSMKPRPRWHTRGAE